MYKHTNRINILTFEDGQNHFLHVSSARKVCVCVCVWCVAVKQACIMYIIARAGSFQAFNDE